MGDTIYLAAAYAVFWVITFVFVYSLVSRQRQLEKEMHLLEHLLSEEPEAK